VNFGQKHDILIAPKKMRTWGACQCWTSRVTFNRSTTFRRRSGDFMKQLRKSKRPVVITVKGKATAVVLDADAYQHLLDIATLANPEEGIRQGLADAKKGKTRPVKEFFDEFEAKHGLPR
jgi:prevent-host-death family protein